MINVFQRLRHRKPAPVPQPSMVESLGALQELAPPIWAGDMRRAIAMAYGREWGRLWAIMQTAADSNRNTPFGTMAGQLSTRAQALDAMDTRPSMHPTSVAKMTAGNGW